MAEINLYKVSLSDASPLYVLARSVAHAAQAVELSGKTRLPRNPLSAFQPAFQVLEITGVELVARSSWIVVDFGNVMEQPAEQGE